MSLRMLDARTRGSQSETGLGPKAKWGSIPVSVQAWSVRPSGLFFLGFASKRNETGIFRGVTGKPLRLAPPNTITNRRDPFNFNGLQVFRKSIACSRWLCFTCNYRHLGPATMPRWTRESDALYELIPDGSSRFVLTVERTTAGKWLAFVSGSEVDDGRAFANEVAAQKAALDSYDNYWSDFE